MSIGGLGRGLSSLIPPSSGLIPGKKEEVKNISTDGLSQFSSRDLLGDRILKIPLSDIVANPFQPRKEFEESALNDLVESIREHGILQPVVVTKNNAGYELVAGERRFRAAQILELESVPAILRVLDDLEKLELAITENIQREDLNPIERAISYQQLMDEFSLKQKDVAKKLGKSREVIANSLRLLSLAIEIQEALAKRKISEGHAKVILGAGSEIEQQKLFKKILENSLTVKQTSGLIKKTKVRSHVRNTKKDPNIVAFEDGLRDNFGTGVKINNKNGQGNITIDFYSLDELKNIIEKMIS